MAQFYPWFKFSFLLFQTHYHVIIIHYHTQKQKKRKFEPRIKLNHNIYMLMFSSSWTFLRQGGLSFLIFAENKEGVRAIQAIKYKKRGCKIYSRTRTFGAEVHKSNIRVKRWHYKYENSESDWKTHLSFKWFAYQVQSYWNTDL